MSYSAILVFFLVTVHEPSEKHFCSCLKWMFSPSLCSSRPYIRILESPSNSDANSRRLGKRQKFVLLLRFLTKPVYKPQRSPPRKDPQAQPGRNQWLPGGKTNAQWQVYRHAAFTVIHWSQFKSKLHAFHIVQPWIVWNLWVISIMAPPNASTSSKHVLGVLQKLRLSPAVECATIEIDSWQF